MRRHHRRVERDRAGNRALALGFDSKPASAVADAIVAGMEAGALEVVRGGEARASMAKLNQDDPGAINRRLLSIKAELETAVRDHVAL